MNSTVMMRRSVAGPLSPCSASASQAKRPEGHGRGGGLGGRPLLLPLAVLLPSAVLLLGSSGRMDTEPLLPLLLGSAPSALLPLLASQLLALVPLPLAAAAGSSGAARLLHLLLAGCRFQCDATSAGDAAASRERCPAARRLRGWVDCVR